MSMLISPEDPIARAPTTPHELSKEILYQWLGDMWLIRRFEEKCAQIYTQGYIGGFCHLCIGQEAISVVSSFSMTKNDTMITAYRSHGHGLARGLSPEQMMAELMGKKTGSSKGKGGSMHLFDPSNQFYGGHGIVGAQIPLGTGLALAHKYKQDNGVCLVFLGDGAANQGQFFEAMNMASLWDLPVLYVIENNGYAMGTSVERACAGGPLFKRGEPFNIEGATTYADDPLVLYAFFKEHLEAVRAQSRPRLIELQTYRFKGHSMSDPGKYRTRSQLDQARSERDPIAFLIGHLKERGYEDFDALEHHATQRIEAAFTQAKDAPLPDQIDLLTDVIL